MYMNIFQKERAEWTILLKKKSNQELINCFNREVRVEGFTRFRAIYLDVLSREIQSRSWDFTEIITPLKYHDIGALCLSNYAYLKDNKVYLIKTHFIYKEFTIFIN